MTAPANLVALLHGPDQPGLVARVAGWIFERGGNIIHADQHRDMEAGVFFQRVEWTPAAGAGPADEADFEAFAQSLGMRLRLQRTDRPLRMAIFVSKIDHCFHDIILRWRAGELAAELVVVVSNHEVLRAEAERYGLRFEYLPVTGATKAEAEQAQVRLLRELRVDLVVMARYMQVLSAEFLASFGGPVINIHHSFLPAFAGGRPYHQAYARGVKLIGATAHYATPILDDGPIIQQGVAPVTHRQSVEDLIRVGRDLEKVVLAQAVRWHLEGRVLVYGNKTVVFD